MTDAPIPIIAYVMIGITSAVLAYVTYYDDDGVEKEEKLLENIQNEPITTTTSSILPNVTSMLPTLPAIFTGKKQEPPIAEARLIEENEQAIEPQEPLQKQQPEQTGGKKTKKNKTKNNKQLLKDSKNNKTKWRR